MDLKEYIAIIRKHFNIFAGIIATVICVSFAVLILKPISYTASLTISIARDGTQETADYKFDDFYRIQADDKFAETIVQWLSSPAIEKDVFTSAGIDVSKFSLKQLSNSLKAEKLSSQVIEVSFVTSTVERARKISVATSEVISKNIATLNRDTENIGKFYIVAQDPVIVMNNFSPWIIFLAALAAGIFLAFWTVLIIHYLK